MPSVTSDPRASLVMVVEDDPAIPQMVGVQLELSGYRSTHVERDGLAALEAVRRIRPDVVLLDIGLPGWTASRCTAGCEPPATGRRSSSPPPVRRRGPRRPAPTG